MSLPLLNQGLLAAASIGVAASLTLFVPYLLLFRELPTRFLRLWIFAGALVNASSMARVLVLWRPEWRSNLLLVELTFAASLLALAAVLDYTGRLTPRRIRLGSLVWVLAAASFVAINIVNPLAATWAASWAGSLLFLIAAIVLWQCAPRGHGHGAFLLAAGLLLLGLNGFDRPAWSLQSFFQARLAASGLLEGLAGIAMIVLVLETARARTAELNERLRQLTLPSAAATPVHSPDQILDRILPSLVSTLGLTHAFAWLVKPDGDSPSLALSAFVGFSADASKQIRPVPVSEPCVRDLIENNHPSVLALDQDTAAAVRNLIGSEKIASLAVIPVPGMHGPLGLLGVGSAARRRFHRDELSFLVNVANLIGFTIENSLLFRNVSEARSQWVYTFDSIEDPILVHDASFRVVRANRALADHLHRPVEEILGRAVHELFRRDAARWVNCPYCEGVAGRGDVPDPTLGNYFLASNSDFHDPSGLRLGTIHTLKDISEHRRAEEQFRNLFENVQEGIFISTPDGHFLDFNAAFLRMTGYEEREQLLRADIPSLYANPDDRERLKRLLRDHGTVENFEFQLRQCDGALRTVTESSFATRDATGNVVSYQGFVIDITDRKQAEQMLRRRNHELLVLNLIGETLGQSLPLDQLLARALRQLVELFALDVGSLYLLDESTRSLDRIAAVGFRSHYASEFPRTVVPQSLLDQILQVRASILSTRSLTLPAIFEDVQAQENIQVSNLVVLWSKNRILGGLVVASRTVREFSSAELNLLTAVASQIAAAIERSQLFEETRRAYENLRQTQEQLLQSEKMAAVGQLISGVAHELNNPLTAILGYSQLLAGSEHVTPRGGEFVDKLYKQAQRTHRIVQNLLSFARPHRPERSAVQINQVIEDTLTLREYDLRLNNIVVHFERSAALPLTSADAHQLQQVFLNILNNAVDAVLENGARGQIWIRTSAFDGRIRIEFTDNGPGVKDPLRVFDPFYTTKAVGKGTGLGLSICYGIIREHAGDIEVRNSPPRGASFTVSLPVAPVLLAGSTSLSSSDDSVSCGRILLVDDEESVLDLEREILERHCESIKTAMNGTEAIEILKDLSVDVVVTDLKMPGEVTGIELYRWIAENRPDLASRVIFTMSDARPEEVRALVEESGCVCVQKPFSIEEFLATVRAAVRKAPPEPAGRLTR